MKVLVFDTETTGLPSRKGYDNYFPYTETSHYDTSRIVSICWNTYENNSLVNSQYHIIKPSNFEIDNKSYACKINGITQEVALKDGINILELFEKLHSDLYNCDIIVAHNLLFDKHILLSEFLILFKNAEPIIIRGLVDFFNALIKFSLFKTLVVNPLTDLAFLFLETFVFIL